MIFYYTKFQLHKYNRWQLYFGKSQFYYIFIFHSFTAKVK
jgi:hypothetical protein